MPRRAPAGAACRRSTGLAGQRPRGGPTRARHAGFTLIELMVVIALVGVFVGFGLDRLRYYQEAAEKTVLDLTLASMRTGLQLKLAALLIQGDPAGIRALQGGNPVQFLAAPPVGYAGERRRPDPGLPGRSWYFDPVRGEMVYVPDLKSHLRASPDADGQVRLRFAVRVSYFAA